MYRSFFFVACVALCIVAGESNISSEVKVPSSINSSDSVIGLFSRASSLSNGNIYGGGSELQSDNGLYALKVQTDSVTYVYNRETGARVWTVPNAARGYSTGHRLAIQPDGNLVLYADNGAVLWASNVYNVGSGPYTLKLLANGNLVVLASDRPYNPNWESSRIIRDSISSTSGSDGILKADDNLVSQNNAWICTMQNDGNLVIYPRTATSTNSALWASGTWGASPSERPELHVQTDGKILLYNRNGFWKHIKSEFSPSGPYKLTMGNDGNLILTNNQNVNIWESGSSQALVNRVCSGASTLHNTGTFSFSNVDPYSNEVFTACGTVVHGPVWYRVYISSRVMLSFEIDSMGGYDSYLQFLFAPSGCSSISSLQCDDNSAGTNRRSRITNFDASAYVNNYIYIQISVVGNNNNQGSGYFTWKTTPITVTTKAVTSGAMTTKSFTSGAMTTKSFTSGAMTTQSITSGAITTKSITSGVMTTGLRNPISVCSNAQTLPSVGSYSFSNKGAYEGVYAVCNNARMHSTVWFKYYVTEHSRITVEVDSFSDGATDSVMQILSDCDAVLACDDDSAGNGRSRISDLHVSAFINTYIYIQIGTYGDNGLIQGSGTFTLSSRAVNYVPSTCSNAEILPMMGTYSFFDNGLNRELETACNVDNTYATVWYKYLVSPENTEITFSIDSMSGGATDSVLQVLTDCDAVLACDDDSAGNGRSRISDLDVSALTDTYIYVQIRSKGGIPGVDSKGSLTLRQFTSNNCESARILPRVGTYSYSNQGTFDYIYNTQCGSFMHSVTWFKYYVPAAMRITVRVNSMTGGASNSLLQINPICDSTIACDDDSAGNQLSLISDLDVSDYVGTYIYIQISTSGVAMLEEGFGTFTLSSTLPYTTEAMSTNAITSGLIGDATSGAVTTSPSKKGGAHGDPLIIGFHGEKFWFHGHVDGIFNIYNDEYVNVNSIFGKATEARGTIMRVIGVEVGGHQIAFGVHDEHSDQSMSIMVDGRDAVATSSSVIHLEGCVEIGMKKGQLIIRTPTHEIKITPKNPWDTRHAEEGHIDHDYLDFVITPPKKEVQHLVGGVIGQTATAKKDTVESRFEVSDLFSAEKSEFYKATEYKC